MTGSSSKARQEWSSEKYPATTSALIASLKQLKHDNPKAVRSNVHLYPATIYAPDDKGEGSSRTRDRRITSWKMTEHMYFNANSQFPTLARGLFTEEMGEEDEIPDQAVGCDGDWEDGTRRERIVARGYDKFFNIDEVEWTNWDLMENHTQPPYYLTLKSNGCLILISALDPQHLLVASKHSLGTTTEAQEAEKRDTADAVLVDGVKDLKLDEGKKKNKQKQSRSEEVEDDGDKEAQAHAEVGRRWLRKTLEKGGRTEADLAKRLWDDNLTAVLELCDDSFEEHVIATPEYWTGLHLHGLNHNTPSFSTAPPSTVSAFATEFGFIPTKYVELKTLQEVKAFTDDIANTGSWEGDQIEGFVVRSTVADATGPGKPPYRPGSPFFFKVKFDEPYLLYRQWREMTRMMLPLTEHPSPEAEEEIWKKVRRRIKRTEIAVYADWCATTMRSEPRLFDGYEKGVVRVRERFLEWAEQEGAKAWAEAKAGKYRLKGGKPQRPERAMVDKTTLPKKCVVVPIAVPGCGKTLIGVALSRLFGFGHTQSDDVTTKRTAPTFLKHITDLLQKQDVVYADRNNHIDKHYIELSELSNVKSLRGYNIRLIAVVWDVQSQPYHRILRVCSERVVKRGNNHQTLRPDLTAEAEHEAVVGNFLRNWTAPDPESFDLIISVQVQDTPQQALTKIIDGLVEPLGIGRPTERQISDALKAAEDYKVTTPYHAPAVKFGKSVRYFGIAPEIDLPKTVSNILSDHESSTARSLFEHLVTGGRVTANPHITLAHEKLVVAEKEASSGGSPGPLESLWNTCKALSEMAAPPMYTFNITFLAWDDRLMALALDSLRPKEGESGAPELVLPDDIALYLHVTVGTKNEEISAYESRVIIRVAREAIEGGITGGEAGEAVEGGGKVRWIKVDGLSSEGRVRGMY